MEVNEKIKSVGTKIKMLRLRKSLRQNDVASKLGITQAYLSNIESGRNAMSLENLFKLQEILHCTMAEFFSEIDEAVMLEERGAKDTFTMDEVMELMKALKK